MTQYEYKVVPAPTRGQKARGVKTPEARFAHALELGLNAHAEDGWEYVRAEVLPSEERQGLTGTATHYRNVLIFRRGVSTLEETHEETLAEEPTVLLEAPTDQEIAKAAEGDTTSDAPIDEAPIDEPVAATEEPETIEDEDVPSDAVDDTPLR